MKLERWLLTVWYGGGSSGWWLMPLGWLTGLYARVRHFCYRRGILRSHAAGVPTVVVGNITVGGTGKTPVVVWLVERLQERGLRVGVLTRGYGGRAGGRPLEVDSATDTAVAGDEAVLIAQRTGAKVVASPDRVAGARRLVARGVDVIVCDDGLQHLRLRRTAEIAVVDGVRRFGNGRFLPAGPLRESPHRLRAVTAVVVNGAPGEVVMQSAIGMRVTGQQAINLVSDKVRTLAELPGRRVHAVAGIGNPARFFELLRAHGLDVVRHVFADHARYEARDLRFEESLPILMTEKDAVKCRAFATEQMWYVPVQAVFSAAAADDLLRRLTAASGLDLDGGGDD